MGIPIAQTFFPKKLCADIYIYCRTFLTANSPCPILSSGLVVITDGVAGLPDVNLFDSLMMQLRHSMISCSFIELGSGFDRLSGLGHVPYRDMLYFIASATFGVYFSEVPSPVRSRVG